MWQRAFRRSRLPIAFSAGYSPRPRVSFGPASPVGMESHAEFLDIELLREVEPAGISARLSEKLPVGFGILEVTALPATASSLSQVVESQGYRVHFLGAYDPVELSGRIEAFGKAERFEIRRERTSRGGGGGNPGASRGTERVIDLRRLVISIERTGEQEVSFWLRAGNEASAKPMEVVTALFGREGENIEQVRIIKTDARIRCDPKS